MPEKTYSLAQIKAKRTGTATVDVRFGDGASFPLVVTYSADLMTWSRLQRLQAITSASDGATPDLGEMVAVILELSTGWNLSDAFDEPALRELGFDIVLPLVNAIQADYAERFALSDEERGKGNAASNGG